MGLPDPWGKPLTGTQGHEYIFTLPNLIFLASQNSHMLQEGVVWPLSPGKSVPNPSLQNGHTDCFSSTKCNKHEHGHQQQTHWKLFYI